MPSTTEIAATLTQNAEHTVKAADEARRNAERAVEGGRVMRDMVQTMERIHDSSRRMGEIIGTNDGIAFQPNILALNAAVEAAREINSLIGSSVEQVAVGADTVRKAEAAIGAIEASSQNVRQLLDQVSPGAREQQSGISQVGVAVQELDRMTQQNAALVEQTAAAAQSVQLQAQSMAAEVSRFKLP